MILQMKLPYTYFDTLTTRVERFLDGIRLRLDAFFMMCFVYRVCHISYALFLYFSKV